MPNVGIGTTTPGSALDVYTGEVRAGSFRLTSSPIALGYWGADTNLPAFSTDANDGLRYNRTTNTYEFIINNTTPMSVNNTTTLVAGTLGIGTGSPRATLDVSGPIVGKASVALAATTADFKDGNIQHTTGNCGAYALWNLKDGGSYTFIVKGTAVATCSFTAFSDAGSTALTVHLPPGHGATISGKHTLYSILVSGSDVYLAWVPGY